MRAARSSRQELQKRSPASRNRTPAASCAASCPRSWRQARQGRLLTPSRSKPHPPLDDLLEGGPGDDVLEAADHDCSVFDVVDVVLVGTRAAVHALQDAPETVYAPLHVLVLVEGDPHHGVHT